MVIRCMVLVFENELNVKSASRFHQSSIELVFEFFVSSYLLQQIPAADNLSGIFSES
jgi:hypothetical protein